MHIYLLNYRKEKQLQGQQSMMTVLLYIEANDNFISRKWTIWRQMALEILKVIGVH